MSSFGALTTLRVGGPIASLVTASTADEFVSAVADADAAGQDLLVLGGGSNLLVGDEGFEGVVVLSASTSMSRSGSTVTAQAGMGWDELVVATLDAGLSGLEALSGVPGTVGGAPIQNIGAYGALVSDVLRSVTVYDRETKAVETWPAERCGFGRHRTSIFKHSRRWVVLDVTLELSTSSLGAPVAYQALADELGVPIGQRVPAADVRNAVLALRHRRGMVLDEADHDTWSVGSFFLNPVLASVPDAAASAPRWPDPVGVKLSAAWLIEHAGFPKGYGHGRAALSTKHTLAITNRGGATASDVLDLAREVRAGVAECFGVTLEPECHLINCSL
jgi:UDP-N-acetylmuramate dehydrogenase